MNLTSHRDSPGLSAGLAFLKQANGGLVRSGELLSVPTQERLLKATSWALTEVCIRRQQGAVQEAPAQSFWKVPTAVNEGWGLPTQGCVCASCSSPGGSHSRPQLGLVSSQLVSRGPPLQQAWLSWPLLPLRIRPGSLLLNTWRSAEKRPPSAKRGRSSSLGI